MQTLNEPIAAVIAAGIAAIAAIIAAIIAFVGARRRSTAEINAAAARTAEEIEARRGDQEREFLAAATRSQEERRHTAALNAVSYFEGGSQKRNIGISQCSSLWKDKDFESYKGIFLDTFYGQVVYVFSEGSNRFEMHELLNVSRMMGLMIEENFFVYPHRAKDVIDAMMQFRDDYSRELAKKPVTSHKKSFIDRFAGELIDEWSDKVKSQAGIK